MIKPLRLLTILFISSMLLTASCKKEGEAGPKGDPGTANVMYSDWFQYSATGNTGNFSYFWMDIAVPQIDQDFINNGGTVLVFTGNSATGDADSVGDIKALPTWGKEGYINIHNDDEVYYDLDYRYQKKQILLNFNVTKNLSKITSADYFFSNVFIGTKTFFRYVLIPGGSKINGRLSQPLNHNDYQAVKAYYSIPD